MPPGSTIYEPSLPHLTAPPLPTNIRPLTDWETTWKALGGVLHPGSLNHGDFEQLGDAVAHDRAESLDHLADNLAGRDLFKRGKWTCCM